MRHYNRSPLKTTAPPADVLAIGVLEARQAQAWNAHDAAAYADLFTPEGDVVNVLGWWWRGRAEIKHQLTEAFAYVFRDSTLTLTEVDVRLLEANVAIVHVRWTLEGAHAPPGAPQPPRQGIQLQVLRRADDGWRIASFQNTNSVLEAPFPKGLPSV
ncbi:MAG: SgcJ/EcaC family oxidoreductase [Anaerolineales bacterium]